MTDRQLIKHILSTREGYEALSDAQTLIFASEEHGLNTDLLIPKILSYARYNPSTRVFDMYKKSLYFSSRVSFDCFMQFVEFDREPNERFYLPRRKVLKPIVDGLQALHDDELDTLFVSQPARTGKSTLCIFFLAWLCGLYPERTNLACAYSDKVTRMFYDGVYEIASDPTYLYREVFPETTFIDTNSKDETLDFGRRKKYKTLTCRSIDGSLNGTCDCNGLLYGDDLVSGIEEALSPDRMLTLWNKITNNLIPRQKRTAKSLYVGTRWSVADPIGRLIALYETEPAYADTRYKVINLPALDENGESNFDYDYNLGFSTNDFLQKKAAMDEPSWLAQCMGEPIERSGLVFSPDELQYFNGVLPDGQPDAVFAAADVAWGGGDAFSMPIGYVYGSSVYIVDVMFHRGDKERTRPIVVSKLSLHKPTLTRFEANNGGHEYKDKVNDILIGRGIKLALTSSYADSRTSKDIRILINAPDIIHNFYFLDLPHQDDQYREFMRELTTFSQTKKNKHDDAPDSLSMLQDMLARKASVKVINRPF